MISTAAGVGMSLIASEHFFSTFLSSPWTTEKFVETEEEKEKIRRLYLMAVGLSLATAALMSVILKQWWPFILTLGLCLFYVWVYEKALAGKL